MNWVKVLGDTALPAFPNSPPLEREGGETVKVPLEIWKPPGTLKH